MTKHTFRYQVALPLDVSLGMALRLLLHRRVEHTMAIKVHIEAPDGVPVKDCGITVKENTKA